LLRLLLPLVRSNWPFQKAPCPKTGELRREPFKNQFYKGLFDSTIDSNDGRCVQLAGTYSAQVVHLYLQAIPRSCRRVLPAIPSTLADSGIPQPFGQGLGVLSAPLYRACGLGRLRASQTYIGPPINRPLSESLPSRASKALLAQSTVRGLPSKGAQKADLKR